MKRPCSKQRTPAPLPTPPLPAGHAGANQRATALRTTASPWVLRCHLVAAFLLAASGLRLSAASLYVAPNGSDQNPGTAAKPFATLERARDELRRRKAAGPPPRGGITVELAAGRYELTRPFTLTAQDSGTQTAPIVYRARRGATVRLSGGRLIKGWTPVVDPAVLARLEPAARGHVWQADLRALGVTDLGEVVASGKRLELFFRDQPMTLARWPNEGFVTITEVLGPTPVDIRGTKGCKEAVFAYAGDRPKRWAQDQDVWAHGYWFWDWADSRQPVAAIDTAQRVIRLRPPYHSYGYRKGQWFYVFNLLSELDQPGEWYLDRERGRLYFWPPTPLTTGAAEVSLAPALVALDGVAHVTLRGLVLEACRGAAIEGTGCQSDLIAGCTIRNTGASAITLAGTATGVVGCDIYQTGAGGITLTGGDRRTLTPGRLYADNNHIHHYSRWERVYQPGISLHGVGNRATHNLISNAPHMAIGFSGNDHLLEFNEIHSVCFESNDAGAIYTGRDWTMRGTVIRYNYLHDISGFEGRGCVGVYLDDQFSGTTVYGNLFYRVTRAAMIGGGRDCSIANNIFVDCVPATHVDARGLGWAADGFAGLKASLIALPYQVPPWSTRYPQLVNILADDPMAPKGNVIAHNICVRGRWGDFEGKAKPLVRFEDNLLDQDPLFVDAPHQDFQLRANSPAYRLGFQRLPLEKIGLYHDAVRASWPVQDPVRPASKPGAATQTRKPI